MSEMKKYDCFFLLRQFLSTENVNVTIIFQNYITVNCITFSNFVKYLFKTKWYIGEEVHLPQPLLYLMCVL